MNCLKDIYHEARKDKWTPLQHFVTTQSLIHADFVTTNDILDGAVPILCIDGDAPDNYPVAPIEVEIGGQKAIVHVGCYHSQLY